MESFLRLDGKVAFITGSTRGIGWATARAMARAGAVVILNGVSSQAALDQRIEELRSEFSVPCSGFLASSTDAGAVKGCYEEIFKQYRRLDVLVNNAGIMQDGLLGMIPDTLIRSVMDVNTVGAIYHLQEAARLMGRNRSGSVINVSSIMGRFGGEGLSVYSASKAALIGLTLSAAKELAPRNIRVNVVAPGFIETEVVKALSEARYKERLDSIKIRRIGQPDDVANAILFLASDYSTYITGQVLGVDGGMVI